MTWWYVSSPRLTCAVELDDHQVIVGGAPIVRRFIGQPAKNLGDWLRKQGEVKFVKLGEVDKADPDPPYDMVYTWGNNEKRATFKGRACRVIARGTMRTVMIEFENGERSIVSHRALRKRANDA